MSQDILNNLTVLKKKYHSIGFLIIGIFGSRARGDEKNSSDLDILYDLDKKFVTKFGGWGSILEIQRIKDEIKNTLHLDVDLASADNNSLIFQKTVKNELIYV
jgi:predicted nucleotidyltransferase